MKIPKHHVIGRSVLVGRVEVATFNDQHQAERFVKFIEKKHLCPDGQGEIENGTRDI